MLMTGEYVITISCYFNHNLLDWTKTTENVLEKKMNEIINENRNISRQLEKLETIEQEVHFLKESIVDLHSKGKTKY